MYNGIRHDKTSPRRAVLSLSSRPGVRQGFSLSAHLVTCASWSVSFTAAVNSSRAWIDSRNPFASANSAMASKTGMSNLTATVARGTGLLRTFANSNTIHLHFCSKLLTDKDLSATIVYIRLTRKCRVRSFIVFDSDCQVSQPIRQSLSFLGLSPVNCL